MQPLPLSFHLKPPVGISVSSSAHTLQPQSEVTVDVRFDPHFKGDRVSYTANQPMTVTFTESMQKESIELKYSAEFPNLTFEQQKVDFGAVLLDSLNRQYIKITNPGTALVDFNWEWMQELENDTSE